MLLHRLEGLRLVMSWIKYGIFALLIMALDVCDMTCLHLSGRAH